MIEYEIKFETRGLRYYENVKARNILEAIGIFYATVGYERIKAVRICE